MGRVEQVAQRRFPMSPLLVEGDFYMDALWSWTIGWA